MALTSIPIPRGQFTGRVEVGVEALSTHLSKELGLEVLDLEVEIRQGMPIPSKMPVQVRTKVNPFLVEMHQTSQLQIKYGQIEEAWERAKELLGG